MQMTGFNVFEFIYQTYAMSVAGAIMAVVDKALAAARGPLDVALVLLLMFYGYEIIAAHGTTFELMMGRVVRISLVVLLISNTSAYDYYVVSFFTTGLPDFFAQHIAGAPGGTNPGAAFDAVLVDMWMKTQTVWEASPGWIKGVFFDIGSVMAFAIVACALVVMFAVFLVVQMLISVWVVFGPLLLLGWLFDYTRKVVNGWLDILVTLSLITLGINILLELLVTAMKTTLSSTDLAGPPSHELFQLLGISLVVLVLSASVVVLPRMLERVAGGVAAGVGLEGARRWMHGGPAWRSAGQAVRVGAPIVSSSVRGGSAAAARGARRITSRLRAPKEG